MIDTDTLKREHPIAEVIARYGVQLRRQGRALVALCPFHRETKPSFTVDPGAGLWYCFGCARGGDVISFVMEMADAGFVEACEILSNGRLPELPHRLPKDWVQMAEPRPPRKLNRAETEALDLAARVYHTTLVVGPKGPGSPYGYLLGRGLTVEVIQEFQLGYCSGDMLSPALRYLRSDPAHAETVGLLRRQDGRTWEFFAGRITFVERNRAGRVIHMAGRAVSGKARVKYLFLPGLPKPVYGLARLDPARPVFVVEGIMDYVTLWQWGYQAMATLGTSIKAQDARMLARATRVVFVPDNDEAGEAAAARWREVVGHGAVLRLPEGVEDVNDLAQQPDGEAIFHRLVEVLEK
ncbi:MAG: DNA primase [Chloroflexota bacterium]|nr:DNA primase [Chloroflexota bacterium]